VSSARILLAAVLVEVPHTALPAGCVVFAIAPRGKCRLIPPRHRVGQERLQIRGVRLVEFVHGALHAVVADLHTLSAASKHVSVFRRTFRSCEASVGSSWWSIMLSKKATFSSEAMIGGVLWSRGSETGAAQARHARWWRVKSDCGKRKRRIGYG
jgi:hypothetical protein